MSGRLDGRTALVTGAGNGIGRACARLLADEGARVVVNDLGTNEFYEGTGSSAADTVVAEITSAGGVAVANYDSVADSQGCGAAVATAVDAFGQLDIVVVCAGVLIDGSITADDDSYQRFMSLFLSSKFWLARAAVPAMAERGWGRLVLVTSAGATGMIGQPVFAAAMGGTISLARGLSHEYKGSGVTANCFGPSGKTRLVTATHVMFEDMHDKGLMSDDDWDSYVNLPPAEYVAPIVAWLCTDAAADVSGEVFEAQGGSIGRWSRPRTDERTIFRGDHRTNPPWTLDELDDAVPRYLLSSPPA